MPQMHRPELSESVAGEPLVTYRRTPRTFGADRVCAAPGCTTRLSIYNDGTVCSAHASHRVGRRPAPPSDVTALDSRRVRRDSAATDPMPEAS